LRFGVEESHKNKARGVFADDGRQVLARLIEAAVNRALRLDPEALRRLGELEGRVLLLEVASEGAPLRVYLLPGPRGLELRAEHEREPDVTISGTVPVFLNQFLRGPQVSQTLVIRGDIELGQRFQRILRRLDPDWEEGLARLIGDVGARQAGRMARGLRDRARAALRALAADTTEYLQEEIYLAAKRERVAQFLREVDRLRADADRLERRVQHLEGFR